MLFLMLLTAKRLSRQNVIILFWKYLVDIRSEAWQKLFWEHINRNLFAVCQFTLHGCRYLIGMSPHK
jgi:hypothetical protein